MGTTKADQLVVVEEGTLRDAALLDTRWETGEGYVHAGGADAWLFGNRGLAAGDFHIRVRLSVHGLKRSAARFSFNMGESSFGFEGNHEKIYITGIVCRGLGTAGALGTPGSLGIEDGKPFLFEVLRNDKRLRFRIDGKTVHTVAAHAGPIEAFGIDPRRATVRVYDFSAEGSFAGDVYTGEEWGVWFNPKVTPVHGDPKWHGPFLHLPESQLLTVVNHEGGIRAFVSADDGKTWQPSGAITKEDQVFEIRDGNEDILLLRTPKRTILAVFLNIADQKISWDRERQEPNEGMKRYTWCARSLDDGVTWQDVQIVQRGYCGALRDVIQASTGEVVLVGQDVARNPGRNVSYTYVSTDDGITWTRSNVMDIGGRGDHAGSIEGTLTQLRDGRLWILLRSYHGHFYECFSEDKGRTWSAPVASAIKASGSPGLLRRLTSGRLVLLWNRFAKGRPKRLGRREELSMAFSEDDGKRWTEPVILVRERGKRQSYPQVFERRPGELWVSTWQGKQFLKLHEKDFVPGE